jgi:protein ImuB
LSAPTACREPVDAVLAGPERIESGWWDDDDVRRDYYVADTAAGRRLWMFRDVQTDAGPFVQGLFG